MRDAADVQQARKLLRAAGGHAGLIAKIERHEAVEHLTEIVDASEGVMVARYQAPDNIEGVRARTGSLSL